MPEGLSKVNHDNMLFIGVDKENSLEFPLDYSLLIYKHFYLLAFVHMYACCISIESSCHYHMTLSFDLKNKIKENVKENKY